MMCNIDERPTCAICGERIPFNISKYFDEDKTYHLSCKAREAMFHEVLEP